MGDRIPINISKQPQPFSFKSPSFADKYSSGAEAPSDSLAIHEGEQKK